MLSQYNIYIHGPFCRFYTPVVVVVHHVYTAIAAIQRAYFFLVALFYTPAPNYIVFRGGQTRRRVSHARDEGYLRHGGDALRLRWQSAGEDERPRHNIAITACTARVFRSKWLGLHIYTYKVFHVLRCYYVERRCVFLPFDPPVIDFRNCITAIAVVGSTRVIAMSSVPGVFVWPYKSQCAFTAIIRLQTINNR